MNDISHPVRRHPAHQVPIERFNEPVIVLVTVCTHGRRAVLACDAVQGICREVWQTADFWRVGRYVIMPDHVHLFCAPGRIPMPSLRQWVEFWKSQIAQRCSLISGGPASASAGRADGVEPVPPGIGIRISGGPTRRADGAKAVPPADPNGGPTSVSAFSGKNPDGAEAVPPEIRQSLKLWQRDF